MMAKQRNAKRDEHGFWSANPGTGWWIVGGVIGAVGVSVGGYFLYTRVIKPAAADLQGPKSAASECTNVGEHIVCVYQDKNPTASNWFYFAVDSGPVSERAYEGKDAAFEAGTKHSKVLDAMPVPGPDKPIPPILGDEPEEPTAGDEPAQGGTLGDVPVPQSVQRHGTIADPLSRTVLIQSRPQWLAFARDYLRKLGWNDMNADALAGTWSRAYPPSVGVGPGWTIAGRPFENLQQHAAVWLEDVQAGTYVTPADFDRFGAAATVTLGESPPEWSIAIADVEPGNVLLAARPNVGDHTIAVRYTEEDLPGQTDRYWTWWAWEPGVLQLRENNAMQRGRGDNRTDAIQRARDFVRTYATAHADFNP